MEELSPMQLHNDLILKQTNPDVEIDIEEKSVIGGAPKKTLSEEKTG